MKILIIGYGSIGMKHARILQNMQNEVRVLSQRNVKNLKSYKNIKLAFSDFEPEYVIVSNNTYEHYETLKYISEENFSGTILIEKPLFHFLPNKINIKFDNIYVGYNLRFHPLIKKLKDEIEDEKIVSLQAYVGQYLPDWRKNRNYKLSYSAIKNKGGGVLRDLSHELDYINWIFGKWIKLCALGGKYSDLKIDTDDVYTILFETENCPVCSVQMNYLDRCSKRNIVINTNNNVYELDLINNIYKKNKNEIKNEVDNDLTYKLMHLEIIKNKIENICNFKSGIEILNMINAAEISTSKKKYSWIYNEKNM